MQKPPSEGLRESERRRLQKKRSTVRGALLLLVLHTVLLQEFLNTAFGVNDLLLAGEKRMAGGANLDVNVLTGRSRFDDITTGAGNRGVKIFRMDTGFHHRPLS